MEPAGRVQNTPRVGASRRRPSNNNHLSPTPSRRFRISAYSNRLQDNQGFNLSRGRPQKRGPVVQPGILALSSSGPKNVRFANRSRSRHRKVAGSNPARSTNSQSYKKTVRFERILWIQESQERSVSFFAENKGWPKGRAFGRRLYILDFLLFFFLATSFAVPKLNRNLLKRYSHRDLTYCQAEFFPNLAARSGQWKVQVEDLFSD
jgi:hypothetical protein